MVPRLSLSCCDPGVVYAKLASNFATSFSPSVSSSFSVMTVLFVYFEYFGSIFIGILKDKFATADRLAQLVEHRIPGISRVQTPAGPTLRVLIITEENVLSS